MKKTKANKAISTAQRLYGEPTPARITGEWLRSRIRADFYRPEGGMGHGTDAQWDALAEVVNGINSTATTATEVEIEKAIAIAEGR